MKLGSWRQLLERGSEEEEPGLWIFGYGSLIWRPGFAYSHSKKALLSNFQRGFWQGNTTHRGTHNLPGRVATIREQADSSVLGLVYRVSGLQDVFAALDHLQVREIDAGYVYQRVRVQLIGSSKTVNALTVVAKPGNPSWLGDSESEEELAAVIAAAAGPAGPNRDYLFALTDALRLHFPRHREPELESLERSVRRRLLSDEAAQSS